MIEPGVGTKGCGRRGWFPTWWTGSEGNEAGVPGNGTFENISFQAEVE